MKVNEHAAESNVNDLGPLAWVLDELRKSLDSAAAALKRFTREAAAARGTDLASVDDQPLRIARQQLHQATGALEMVGLPAPAQMLRAMESAAQRFVERPETCNDAATQKIERAGFALVDYLQGMLLGKPLSSTGLFPQYRDVQELAGADRVHPADLWSFEWKWIDAHTAEPSQPLRADATVRGRMDHAVLQVVKASDAAAAGELAQISLGLAGGAPTRQVRAFWKIASAFFEALALGILPVDVYVKRAGSRILLQYASLAKGETTVSERLAQDLLFFCAQSVPVRADQAPVLSAVRLAWGLAQVRPVDYHTPQFGRFDPSLLAQARKRIVVAKETWSQLAGGDTAKLRTVAEQFRLMGEAIAKLHPPSTMLAQTLAATADDVAQSGQSPRPELAMEVATSLLYLEAAFEDLDPDDAQLGARTSRLAERLKIVQSGGRTGALEPWMEELYRRVSDRQTMGSVVGELRVTLGELEKSLDAFFRNTADKTPLRTAPSHLAQMRGVLSVLGLDHAAQAVTRMRDTLEEMLVTEIDEARARGAGTFDLLGNNLGALGFLIDMLNYQPTLAKKLFVYDEAKGELLPLMGRAARGHEDAAAAVTFANDLLAQEVIDVVNDAPESGLGELTARLDTLATHAVLADQAGIAHTAREAAAAVNARDAGAASAALNTLVAAVQPAAVAAPAPSNGGDDIEEDDLRDIFLEEAREVVQTGRAAVAALAANPADLNELTTLRRAFHTLKGSSRMVGLTQFGDAGWSMEQVLNAWLADGKPASDGLRALAGDALQAFGVWVEDVASGQDARWSADRFSGPAEAWRASQTLLPIERPAGSSDGAADFVFDFDDEVGEVGALLDGEPVALTPAPDVPGGVAVDFAFDLDLPSPTPSPTAATPAALEESIELGDADFAEFIDLSGDAEPLPAAAPVPAAPTTAQAGDDDEWLFDVEEPVAPMNAAPLAVASTESDFSFDLDAEPVLPPATVVAPVPVMAAVATVAAVTAMADESPSIDDQTKVIGDLRIGLPLYNVYLNEADEWSRRLVTEVGEWALESSQPVGDSTVGLAHALAGASATVGFTALSDIARSLEHELQRSQTLAAATPAHTRAFVDAAEEIRRLLHQFAAGFLKEPNPAIAQALSALSQLDLPQRDDTVTPSSPGEDSKSRADAPRSNGDETVVLSAAAIAAQVALAKKADAAATPSTPASPVAPLPVAMRPLAATGVLDDDEDIDIADAVDPDLFPIFEEEAVELVPKLGTALRQWVGHPSDRAPRTEVLRVLHTLKGSARLAGALRLGEMAHRMESEIEYFGSDDVAGADLEPLLHRLDTLQHTFEALCATGGVTPVIAGTPVIEPTSAAMPDTVATETTAAKPAALRGALAAPVTTLLAPQRAAANQAVRVRSQLLDRLMNQAGEVIITRSRLEAELGQLRGSLKDLTGNLDRLRSQLRDVELQAESQMQSRLAQAKDTSANFDPLEFDRFTRVQELTRMMAESVNDVATVQRNLQRTVEATEDDLIAQGRQTRELQRDLLRTRMVEFEGISDRLYRVVRLASKETGKQVKLDIVGGSIEMDRGVLDRMTPAFEHLLRNCVAHGIEEPATREKAGKDAAGTILVTLHHEGNDVSVEFRDDGAGLDVKRIREKAEQQGLIAKGHAISDAEAANLIFMPGFTTAAKVTELAGRGIGMDVVRAELNALGGRVETSTQQGKGTNFKLVLPLTTAVTQVVMIRAGQLTVGVPSTVVETVLRVSPKDVERAYAEGTFTHAGASIPFHWSGALLQASTRSVEPPARSNTVMVFQSAGQRVAAHVDEVLGNQEVVVKNLGPQLARLPGLAGMTVLASGAVVLIYNPVALTSVYGEQARQLRVESLSAEAAAGATAPTAKGSEGGSKKAVLAVPPQIPLVLVVDDSITVRRVTQRLLQREGYRVALAADGLQAIERLAEEKPTVVLSDIEMPRMDGFDLARNIRGDSKLADLPIIMITSRIAEKHREHARELGVNHYLGKPYSEDELISLIKHYCVTAAATA